MKVKTMIKALASILCTALLLQPLAGCGSDPEDKIDANDSDFYNELVENYAAPSIENRTGVRWWMAEGAHTDETLLEDVQAMYDAGFREVELCQLNQSGVDASIYGYGSEQWDHDFKLVLNKALDLGMTVGITSGTNWATSNVPGLDPDTDQGNQAVFETHESLSAGSSRSGNLPTNSNLRAKATYISSYAYKLANSGTATSAIEIDGDSIIDLTPFVQLNADNRTGTLSWTAPDDGNYIIFHYWQQATAEAQAPSTPTAYCVNYFDKGGVEALKEYWLKTTLSDPALNKKIANGDVQVFMDSPEYSTGAGFLNWASDFREEFLSRKGYDITPYLILGVGLPEPKGIDPGPNPYGTYNLTDAERGQRILNDYHDVLTELYMEEFLLPLRDWLHEYGIRLRMQVSYGKYLEISEPSMAVDFPETENLNQANQVDMYRIWSGAAHLENKVLSSETSATMNFAYAYDFQTHLQEAYTLYAGGISRIIWHIWSSQWAPTSVGVDWPGYKSMNQFNVFSLREPGYTEYRELNNHLGRAQELLREGVSRTDIGMPHMKYGELILAPSRASTQKHQNWMLRHETMPGYFASTKLQDNGYTYDYFSPELFNSEDVYYNAKTGSLELAGYRAIVLYEDWLTLDGAQKLLEFAKQGLKVVVMDGAAVQTPYDDGNDLALRAVINEMKLLPNVRTAVNADAVYDALQALGVQPYAAFGEENYQLLTQVREKDGNMFLYAYNYCNDKYCGANHNSGMGHGTNIQTEIEMDGLFIPYRIDAWTGEIVKIANYRYANGKTIIPINLDYGDIALYAFEKATAQKLHVQSTNSDYAYIEDGNMYARDTVSGAKSAQFSDGTSYNYSVNVPQAFALKNWDLTVESWTPGSEIFREETVAGVTSREHTFTTTKTQIDVTLETLTTWNNIAGVGKNVSGKGYYRTTFTWDGEADGAYLDFGSIVQSMQLYVNDKKVSDVNMNKPNVDIGDYLVVGTNTIYIEYSSNMTNVQLSRGKIAQRTNVSNLQDYNVRYRSYGLWQAIVVPYKNTLITHSS